MQSFKTLFLWFMRSNFYPSKKGYYYILVQTTFSVLTPRKPSAYAGFGLCNILVKTKINFYRSSAYNNIDKITVS